MRTLNELFYNDNNEIRANEELGNEASELFKASEFSLFEGTTISAYLNGIRIPSYVDTDGNEHESIKKSGKGLSYAKIGELVGKSKTTINDYVNVLNDIINEGLFEGFVNQKYRFSIKKVRMILENQDILVDEKHSLEELFEYTEKAIEDMLKRKESKGKKSKESDADGDNEGTTEATTDAEESANIEYAVIMYNDELYKVEKSALDKLLETAEKVVNE